MEWAVWAEWVASKLHSFVTHAYSACFTLLTFSSGRWEISRPVLALTYRSPHDKVIYSHVSFRIKCITTTHHVYAICSSPVCASRLSNGRADACATAAHVMRQPSNGKSKIFSWDKVTWIPASMVLGNAYRTFIVINVLYAFPSPIGGNMRLWYVSACLLSYNTLADPTFVGLRTGTWIYPSL